MHIQPKHLLGGVEILLDVLLILFSFQAAYCIKVFLTPIDFHGDAAWFRFQISVLYAFIFIVSSERLGQYESKTSLLNVQEKAGLFRAVFTATILFMALNGFFSILYSSWDVVTSSLLVLATIASSRHFFFKYHHKRYLEGKHERKVLIYGAGETGQLLFKKLYFMEGGDYSLIGFLDDHIVPETTLTLQRSRSKAPPFRGKVLGGLQDLERIVKANNVFQVIIAMPSVSTKRILEIIQACVQNGVSYGFVPHLYNLRLEQVDTKNIGDIPLLKKRDYHLSFLYMATKRIFDCAVSFITLIGFLPFFPFLALLVKMGNPGPVFFKQKRVGKNGKLFTMYKFRTMSVATPIYMPSPSSNVPSRYVNKIGSFLRDTNLDEIPQLWNVLMGDMSIVGPRPEMPFHVEKYDAVQRDRLQVQPGLTGLWQISPDRDKEIHENIDYDLYYINHQSFFLDLVLVVETFLLTCQAIWNKVRRFLFSGFSTSQQNRGVSSQDPLANSPSAPSRERALL